MQPLSKSFKGFSPESPRFLFKVRENNSKTWFEQNKHIYQRYLLEPFKNLVHDLTDTMLDIDPGFEVRPVINRTISKIYRDTRFSRDKSLFKSTMWLTFKRPSKEWKNAPAFYFEMTASDYRFGMGYYEASSNTMAAFRKSIDTAPAKFLKAISFYTPSNPFRIEGPVYKRPIRNDHPQQIQVWYQRKSFYLASNHEINELLFSSHFVDTIASGFTMLKPLYWYLMNLKTE